MEREHGRHQNTFRLSAAVLVALMLSVVPFSPASAAAQSEGEEGLRVVGQMTRPPDFKSRPMAVDEDRSLGFVASPTAGTLDLLDLERLVVRHSAPDPVNNGSSPERTLAMDTRRERLYAVGRYAAAGEGPCTSARMRVWDYRVRADGQRRLFEDRIGPMPCSGSVAFLGLTTSYYRSPTDPKADRLYVGGLPATEGWRTQFQWAPLPTALGGGMQEDRGQPLLVRQMAIQGDGLCGSTSGSTCPNPNPSSIAQPVLDWEVDLRVAGCGRRERVGSGLFDGFVARLANDVVAYCWDARAHRALSVGQQGYLVRIPLAPDADGVMRPLTRGAPRFDPATGQLINYVFRRTPTLGGKVTPLFDPVSGRVLLVTADVTNGNAVWVFDPRTERFVGVITGGYGDQKRGNTAVGFDAKRGRVYVLTQAGVLIAPVRVDPLPAGLLYPVLVNDGQVEDFASADRISVAPALGRLFVAVGGTYQVLEDRVPDPATVVPADPDALTSDVIETERTASTTAGQALASGAHVVSTGGAARAVGQNDPTCRYTPPNFSEPGKEDQLFAPDWEVGPALVGSCLAEVAVSAGHREAATAATELEASTGGGASARGAALVFGSNDSGTDGDVRRTSGCGAESPEQVDRWGRRWPFPDNATIWVFGNPDNAIIGGANKKGQEKTYNQARDAFWDGFVGSEQFQDGQSQYRGGCDQLQDGVAQGSGQSPTGPVDLRSGTRGPDGKGFPVRGAACGDFGARPVAETWPEQSAGMPQAGYPTSSVSCDASVPGARGDASAGALALPSATDAQVSVSRVSSKVTSMRTADEGQVTMAFASASGVTVGPLSIAEVRSLAVTKAAGRKGTTSAVLVRQWCGLAIQGQAQQGCVDPDSQQAKDLLDEVSAALLQKVQLSVPEGTTQATPKGYQAVVTKSAGQRGADQTVNDDDSHTVAALQAIVYNDGPRGRSRLIVQLAGVHAESRYGIIELPNFGGGSFGEPEPEPGPTEPEPEPAPGEPVAEVPPAPAPPPDPFTPESFVEEDFGPTEQGRFSPAPPPGGRVITDPVPPLRRIVRVPVQILSDAINLLVQNPREAALLFVMWALLAAPFYLGLRRRSFARALVT